MARLAPLLGILLAACGPIEYIANVPLEASGAVAEARHVKAEKYAPYEITAAQEYLHKSRELAGYARFHSSVEFARKATKLAQQAKQLSGDRASLPDEKNEENPTAPVPAGPPPSVEAPPAREHVPTVIITPAKPNPTSGDSTDVPTVHTDKPSK